ncbi:DoxX family protein [Thermoflavimicrobium dichotomicum]|uniref:Putative oxidoreductase n=1 Tax=Thermoflavimicrobium dichotomicum TaxID=46223 RepID=A0A1I3U0U2_9BACL|nr:DoxX family protein [Thermoflavimicrobium dichotomicum]SFJ76605.1 putative oxidoreductase [Thermoflavimicrobium dichotomicum]
MSLGLLIIRLVVGLTFMGHGCQKLFGWFGGHGLKGTGGWMESIGIRPGTVMALLAGLSELIGGFLFAAGVFIPIASILIVGTMLVAIFKVHGQNGYWITNNGFEYNFVLIAVAIGIGLVGGGDYTIELLWK